MRTILSFFSVLLLSVLFVGSAQAANKMEVAVQDDSKLVHVDAATRNFWLDRAQQLNADYIRVNLRWAFTMSPEAARSTTKPSQVEYNWSAYDDLVNAAAARGIKVQLTLTGSAPAWATSNKKLGVYNPSASEYGLFVRQVTQHFNGRVSRIAVWNEPNWHSLLQPSKKAPTIYRSLYIAAYNNVKAVNPNTQVLFGELAPYARGRLAIDPADFTRKALCVNSRGKKSKSCATLRADGFAIHPYDFKRSPNAKIRGSKKKAGFVIGNFAYANKFIQSMNRAKALRPVRGKNMPIYLSEYGFFVSGSRKISDRRHASYLVSGFQKALRAANVRQLVQYQLAPSGRGAFWDTSIYKSNGAQSRAAKALAKWAKKNRKHLA